MGTVQETWQDRRDQILQAAMDVLANDGASSLTIRRVAKVAGVDPALIYHYFGSKADLLQEVTYIPITIMTALSDPTHDLAWKLSLFEVDGATQWISALLVCLADAQDHGKEQFELLLDLLLPDATLAKRTMVVGLLVERYLLGAPDCVGDALQRYTQLVEAV